MSCPSGVGCVSRRAAYGYDVGRMSCPSGVGFVSRRAAYGWGQSNARRRCSQSALKTRALHIGMVLTNDSRN